MLHMHSKSVFSNIFNHVKQSGSKSKEKVGGNGIAGREVEMVMLTIRIWTTVKNGDCFREKSFYSRVLRKSGKKHPIKDGLEYDNFVLFKLPSLKKKNFLNWYKSKTFQKHFWNIMVKKATFSHRKYQVLDQVPLPLFLSSERIKRLESQKSFCWTFDHKWYV